MELLEFAAENYDTILENSEMGKSAGAFGAAASASYMVNFPLAVASSYKLSEKDISPVLYSSKGTGLGFGESILMDEFYDTGDYPYSEEFHLGWMFGAMTAFTQQGLKDYSLK